MSEYVDINYGEICKFYWNIYFLIFHSVDEQCSKDLEIDKKVSDIVRLEENNIYAWLDGATNSLGDLENILEFSNEENFFYFAMSNLNDARKRFEYFLNESKWSYPEEVYNYTKYDDLVVDYYDKFAGCEDVITIKNKYYFHYYRLSHRKNYYKYIKKYNLKFYENLEWFNKFVDECCENNNYDYPLKKIYYNIQKLSRDINVLKEEVDEKEDDCIEE